MGRQFGWGQFGFWLGCLGKLGSFLPRTRDKNYMGSRGGGVFHTTPATPTPLRNRTAILAATSVHGMPPFIIIPEGAPSSAVFVVVPATQTWLSIWSVDHSSSFAQACEICSFSHSFSRRHLVPRVIYVCLLCLSQMLSPSGVYAAPCMG